MPGLAWGPRGDVRRTTGAAAVPASALPCGHAQALDSKELVSPLWTRGLAGPALDAPGAHRGPADVTAAALRASTDAQTPTVHATANSGAKGAARRTAPGIARFSPAPAATGSSTTCRGAQLAYRSHAAQASWAERWHAACAEVQPLPCGRPPPVAPATVSDAQTSRGGAQRGKGRAEHAARSRQASTLVGSRRQRPAAERQRPLRS